MLKRPPIVDTFGNINVHQQEDIYIPIAPGLNIGSLAGRALLFEINGGKFVKVLEAHPSNPNGRLIHVANAELRSFLSNVPFALIDTTGGVRKTYWSGILKRYL